MTEKIRVLYVDDECALLELGKVYLERSGDLTVTTAISVPEATRLLEQEHFDAIVSDYQMPEKDGIEFLKNLKAEGNTTPFIIFTGKGREEVVIDAINSGADGYLQKGGEPKSQFAELKSRIEQAVRRWHAEAAFRESEERYRALFEGINNGVAVYEAKDNGRDFIFKDFNRAGERIDHDQRERLIGKSLLAMRPGVEQFGLVKVLQRVWQTGKPESYPVALYTDKQLTGWYENYIYKLPSGEIVTVFENVTEHRRVEEALRVNLIKYETLFESFPLGITISDNAGNIIESNQTAEILLGLSQEQQLKRQIDGTEWTIIQPDGSPMPTEKYASVRALKEHCQISNVEMGIVKSMGDVTWINVTAAPIPLDGYGVAITYGDITGRKRAEEEQARLAAIVEQSDEAIIGKTLAGQITNWNAGAERMYGYTAEEMLTQNISLLVPPGHVDDTGVILDRIKNGEPVVRYETLRRRNDGGLITVTLTASPIRDTNNQLVGASVIGHDITGRKRAEEALQRANKQLNLLSSITRHDILNQLMALKGYLYLSNEMIENPATLTGYIQKMEQVANAIEHQITFTKDYQELGATAPEWQNVNECIRKAVSGLPMREVHVEIDPHNPEVFADRLFEKVFYNLVDNALRYGGEKMTTIRVSSQEIDMGLLIVCEDDGVGISAEDKKRLFTRGFGKNTGLGLFLSREILAITGITITENGVPGKGGRFEITVPTGMWRMKGVNE